MPDRTSREIHLAARPVGWPTEETFALKEEQISAPADGEVLVRNLVMSVDPYMRGRMNDAKSYVPPFAVGEVLDGGAVGVVLESRSDDLAPGDTVLHGMGWRDLALGEASRFRKVDSDVAAPSDYLGVLGLTGFTAYVGLLDIAAMTSGDAVFVSGAAGAVGGMVGQFARLRGASRVIGSAGSAEKVAFLTERLGFDAAFNYHDGPVRDQLRAAAPDGIDVYFDNVGGEHLEAALTALRPHGRVAMCGAVAQYNDTTPPAAPRNLALVIGKRLTVRGFIVGDHSQRMDDFVREVNDWRRDGRLVEEETVVDGLENAPAAFLGLLRGDNMGKMIVRISNGSGG